MLWSRHVRSQMQLRRCSEQQHNEHRVTVTEADASSQRHVGGMRRDKRVFDLEAGWGLHDHHGLDSPQTGGPHLVLVDQQRYQYCLRYLHPKRTHHAHPAHTPAFSALQRTFATLFC